MYTHFRIRNIIPEASLGQNIGDKKHSSPGQLVLRVVGNEITCEYSEIETSVLCASEYGNCFKYGGGERERRVAIRRKDSESSRYCQRRIQSYARHTIRTNHSAAPGGECCSGYLR